MNSLMFHTFFLFALIANAYGRIVHFSLITFGQEATVTFNGNTLPLQPVDNFSGVRGASAICPDEEFEYTYTLNGKAEGFTRKLPAGELTTHNEFFGRKETVSPLKGMGYPIDKPQWTRSIGKTEVFDDSYIPTVILDDGSRDFFITGNDTWVLGRFTLVLKDEIFTEENVPTKAQNRYHDKFQWRVKLEKKIHKRKVFKFRSNSADPTFFRQSLYADMVAAVGNPVHNQVIVRAYLSDGTPIGLYLMIEVTSSKSFIKSQFYGNEETGKITAPQQLGFPLDCSTGADFTAQSNVLYGFSNTENETKLWELMSKIDQTDPTNADAVKDLNDNWIDLNTFFKALALEYLAGHWDSYWFLTTNFAVYGPPGEKYYFIDQDFDQTWSVGMKEDFDPENWPKKPYTEYVKDASYWKKLNSDLSDEHGTRAIVNKFIGCDGQPSCQTKDVFENHLKSMVQHIFNPVALERKVNGYIERLDEEIKWDYGLERLHVGSYAKDATKSEEYYHFTYDNWVNGFKLGPNSRYGVLEWTKIMADTVCNQFGIKYDEVPLTPEDCKKLKEEDGPGNALKTNNQVDGSVANRANITLALVATLLSIVLFL